MTFAFQFHSLSDIIGSMSNSSRSSAIISKILSIAILLIIFICILVFVYARGDISLPSFKAAKGAYSKSDTILIDRKGEVIHERRGDFHGRPLLVNDQRHLTCTPKNHGSLKGQAVLSS